MNDGAAFGGEITGWRIDKRHEGVLFEVVEGGAGLPTVVTFRDERVAPHESYAWDFPFRPPAVRELRVSDAAALGAVEHAE